MSVSQVETLAVYAGTADPPSDLDAITATSSGTAPATGGTGAGTESTSKAAPGMAVIIGVAAGVGGAVLLTGERGSEECRDQGKGASERQ